MKITEHRFFEPFILALVFIFLFSITYGLIYNDRWKIDTTVETIDGKIYKTAETNSSDNGLTYIGYPYDILIQTKNVKIIYK
jgi:hypothetical protein